MGKATHGLIKENPMQQFTFKVYPNGGNEDWIFLDKFHRDARVVLF